MTNDRLSALQVAVLTAYSAGMSAGQMLFKVAANRSNPNQPLSWRLLDLIQDLYFLAALVLYGAFAVLWVWILTMTPLSRAYPFVALAFVVTPVLGALLFNEAISMRLLVGIALILCGLLLVAV